MGKWCKASLVAGTLSLSLLLITALILAIVWMMPRLHDTSTAVLDDVGLPVLLYPMESSGFWVDTATWHLSDTCVQDVTTDKLSLGPGASNTTEQMACRDEWKDVVLDAKQRMFVQQLAVNGATRVNFSVACQAKSPDLLVALLDKSVYTLWQQTQLPPDKAQTLQWIQLNSSTDAAGVDMVWDTGLERREVVLVVQRQAPNDDTQHCWVHWTVTMDLSQTYPCRNATVGSVSTFSFPIAWNDPPRVFALTRTLPWSLWTGSNSSLGLRQTKGSLLTCRNEPLPRAWVKVTLRFETIVPLITINVTILILVLVILWRALYMYLVSESHGFYGRLELDHSELTRVGRKRRPSEQYLTYESTTTIEF